MTARDLIKNFNNPDVDFALDINAIMKALEIALDTLDDIEAMGFGYSDLVLKAKAQIDGALNGE